MDEQLIDPDVFTMMIPDVPMAVTTEEQEEWRWYIDPRVNTPAEQSRAECSLQPLVSDGSRDARGRLRPRPTIVVPEERPQNGYDHLFDPRAYSPNHTVRGYWDTDPEEIERENAFTPTNLDDIVPPVGQRPWIDFIPPRTPSPTPEEGSLDAMLTGSLAGPRVDSPGLPWVEPPNFRNGMGIRRHEIPEFTRRFRALPHGLQGAVIQQQRDDDIFWMDALRDIETQVWLYNLSPIQRGVLHSVQALDQTVNSCLDEELDTKLRLVTAAKNLLRDLYPITEDAECLAFLGPLQRDGVERGFALEREWIGIEFWIQVFNIAVTENLSSRLREISVLRLLNIRRIERFEAYKNVFNNWLNMIGDVSAEASGLHQRGDFWTMLPD